MTVPESIKELRTICQVSPQWQVHQPWAFLQIRKASIYLTWLLLHFPVTANGVSVAGIAVGILSGVLLGATHFVGGALLLQLAILCDFSDGEVSRYRRQQSKEGSYLDKAYHFLVPPAVFAGLTIGVFQLRPSLWVLIAGFIGTICGPGFVLIAAYGNELAIWRHSRKLLDKVSAELSVGAVRSAVTEEMLRFRSDEAGSGTMESGIHRNIKESGIARRITAIAPFWDFPYVFWVITAGIIIDAVVSAPASSAAGLSGSEIVLLFYAVTYPVWIVLYMYYVLATKATERGFIAFADDLSVLLSRVQGTKTGQ